MATKKRASKKSAAKKSAKSATTKRTYRFKKVPGKVTKLVPVKRAAKRKSKSVATSVPSAPAAVATMADLNSATSILRGDLQRLSDRVETAAGPRITEAVLHPASWHNLASRDIPSAPAAQQPTIFDTVNRITNVAHDVEARSFNLTDSLQVPNGENGIAAAGQSQTSAPQPSQPSLTHQLSRIELALERINHNMNKIAEMYVG